MLSIAHSVTGAFLAVKLQHPLLYVPATLGAHYLEDWIKHWDVGTGLTNGTRKRSHAFLFEWIDLTAAAGLVLLFYPVNSAQSFHPYIGAFTALIPDFLEFPKNFLHWDLPVLKPLNKIHNAFHNSTPNIILGLLPQFLLVIVLYFLR